MTYKLVLINPVNSARVGLSVNQSSRFPPISLGILAALTPSSWDIELVDENWESFSYRPADLVGITAFTASANRAYEIAALYRQHNTPVVMGGIHASMCPDEALQYVDSVVIGEAENIWPGLVADVENACLQKVYRGAWNDLAGAVRPRRDLFHPGYVFASVQTSRGCPMNCSFCSVTTFNGQRYRRRPTDEVIAELATIPQKMLFFVDDNIVGYSLADRDQAIELFQKMVERKLNKWWFCQASINFGDDEELLKWAARAGCAMVFLGLEADENESLAQVNKRLNATRGVHSYSQTFARIQRAGIAVLGAFIFGLEPDTPEKLKQRTDFMIQSGIDVMQTTYLTPLPGTPLFQQYQQENRLLYADFPADWEHFNMTEVTHCPKYMSLTDLECMMAQANQRMYAWTTLGRKALGTLVRTRSLRAAMMALGSNMAYRNVALANTIKPGYMA